MALGNSFSGHSKITGRGAAYVEKMEKPLVPNVSYHFQNALMVQIGDDNTMNVGDVAQSVAAAIDASNASPEQKAEAKTLWSKLTNNQTFAAIVGAVAAIAMSSGKTG